MHRQPKFHKVKLMKTGWSKYILLSTLLLLTIFRFHLAFARYFDSDEFAHLHWSWLIVNGFLPYRHFFFYITPFFQWLVAPFFLLPPGGGVLLLVRVFQLLIFMCVAVMLYRIVRHQTGSVRTGLLASAVFTAFPMTLDKTIDIRPDMPMIALFLITVYIFISTRTWNSIRALLSGFCISLSILLLPKILFAVPALILLFLISKPRMPFNMLVKFASGAAIPGLILFLYYLSHSLTGEALRSILVESVTVNSGKTPFSPWKALSPWPLVYLQTAGPSIPWYVNTAIWILAVPGFLISFLKNRRFGLFLGAFFAGGIVFLFAFPAPYLQYFLPLSVFAAYLASESVEFLIGRLDRLTKNNTPAGTVLTFAVLSVLVSSFYLQYRDRVSAGNTNDEQLQVIASVLSVSEPDETFYDMVGSYVFRPDGYIICCHPYAEFADRLGHPVPGLKESLVTAKTRFIVLDRTGMSLWKSKPDDLAFIKSHYLPARQWKLYTLGSWYSCRDGLCYQHDLEKQLLSPRPVSVLDIVIPENYSVATVPPDLNVTIDGIPVSGKPVFLEAGSHRFTVDRSAQNLTVQLAK